MNGTRATLQSGAIAVAGLLWLSGSAGLIAHDPWLGLALGISPVAAVLLVRFSGVRLIAVVVGGMFVLGSSSDLSVAKLAYTAILVAVAAVSAWRLMIDPPAYLHHFRGALWFGLAFVGVLAISFLASPAGSDFGSFGRSAIFYVLILLGPIIGLDAGRDLNPRVVYAILGIVGVVAAVGFAIDWLNRRGVTALSIDRIVLSSLQLPALSFALAVVLLFHGRGIIGRLAWAIPVLVIPIAMLVTGTRTNLIIFAAPAFVLGRLRNVRVPLLRMLLAVAVIGFIGASVFSTVAHAVVQDTSFIDNRIEAALQVLTGDASVDQSYSIRSAQYAIAAEMIRQSPLWGYGLGYTIPFTLDTPLLTVVRLGWVGSVVIVGYLVALSVAVWRTRREYGPGPAHVAWWGFAGVILLNIPFGTPLEDRGFGFAIMLAMMAIASEITHPRLRIAGDESRPRAMSLARAERLEHGATVRQTRRRSSSSSSAKHP